MAWPRKDEDQTEVVSLEDQTDDFRERLVTIWYHALDVFLVSYLHLR